MLKLVGLFSAKPGTTCEDARHYYEEHHAPLIMELFGAFLADYRRSYIDPASVLAPNRPNGAPAPPLNFDVVVEMWFDSTEMLQQSGAVATSPDVAKRIAEDEERFLDRESMVTFLVDEQPSPRKVCP